MDQLLDGLVCYSFILLNFDSHFNLIETRLPQWNTSNHHQFGLSFKNEVKLLLILSHIDRDNRIPNHPSCPFYKLPRDIIYYLFQLLSQQNSISF